MNEQLGREGVSGHGFCNHAARAERQPIAVDYVLELRQSDSLSEADQLNRKPLRSGSKGGHNSGPCSFSPLVLSSETLLEFSLLILSSDFLFWAVYGADGDKATWATGMNGRGLYLLLQSGGCGGWGGGDGVGIVLLPQQRVIRLTVTCTRPRISTDGWLPSARSALN